MDVRIDIPRRDLGTKVRVYRAMVVGRVAGERHRHRPAAATNVLPVLTPSAAMSSAIVTAAGMALHVRRKELSAWRLP